MEAKTIALAGGLLFLLSRAKAKAKEAEPSKGQLPTEEKKPEKPSYPAEYAAKIKQDYAAGLADRGWVVAAQTFLAKVKGITDFRKLADIYSEVYSRAVKDTNWATGKKPEPKPEPPGTPEPKSPGEREKPPEIKRYEEKVRFRGGIYPYIYEAR